MDVDWESIAGAFAAVADYDVNFLLVTSEFSN